MASADARIAALARTLSRPINAPARVPRAPQLSLHQGLIASVDVGTNTVHWQFNGSDVVAEGVRYLHAYSPLNPPQVGDVAWAQLNGTSLLVLGRHVIPDSTIVLP